MILCILCLLAVVTTADTIPKVGILKSLVSLQSRLSLPCQQNYQDHGIFPSGEREEGKAQSQGSLKVARLSRLAAAYD
jgi:hypothetical protein